jgi:hydrogenase maturation protease
MIMRDDDIRPLVVGLGSPDRGDDATGPTVVRRIAAMRLPGIRVIEREDPTSLIDMWDGFDPVLVVDAVRSGRPPGTLMVIETGSDAAPLPERTWASTGRGGTHAFGLAAAIELARALGRLPRRVVLVGIEIGGLGYGQPLSPRVAAAVNLAVEVVIGSLWETGALPSAPTGTSTSIPRAATASPGGGR